MLLRKFKLMLVLLFGSTALWGVSGFAANAQISGVSPSYFEVSGVAANDVLNIRQRPDANSEIVGSFTPGEKLVEVVLRNGNWGYVMTGEQMGWVSTKFLTPIEVPRIGQSSIPVGLKCLGNEPFWDITLDENSVSLSNMGEEDQAFNIVTAGGYLARGGWDGFIVASGQQSMMTVVLSTGVQCSDGMSDRDYGWRADMLITDNSGTQGKTGCCTLQPWR